MASESEVQSAIRSLTQKYGALEAKEQEAEKRAEDFLRPLFEALGWNWLSTEVTPQKKVRGAQGTKRVDFAFRKSGDIRPSFYLEVKRFSADLDNPDHIRQALMYGKNSGTRWIVLTNFHTWKVFNSDFYSEPGHAELFEFTLPACLENTEPLRWLLLLSRDAGWQALDDYARRHKKWKETADIEVMLTGRLREARYRLSKALYGQNPMMFGSVPEDQDTVLDECVQEILDRLIFCRMLEDNAADPDWQMRRIYERWQQDKRVQFYKEFLVTFWEAMNKRYDSTIFKAGTPEGMSLKNEDFVPIFRAFYEDPDTGLEYRFDAITTDLLGHAYEEYLSYKTVQTAKRTRVEKEDFRRKQSGIYYTPEFMVDFLVRTTVGENLKSCRSPEEALRLRILDPACGSGTFLVRALDEFRQWFAAHNRQNGAEGEETAFLYKVVEQCLYGVDLDSRAVKLAELRLFIYVVGGPGKLPKPNIIYCNSLLFGDDIPKLFPPFRLEREFPLVHEQGGFDVVITNPPWEKWKPDSQEYFEEFFPGFKSLPAQKAKKVMAELMKKRSIRIDWDHKLLCWRTQSDIFRALYRYQSADAGGRRASGDLDLYKLFTERAFLLLKPGGRAGIVVPSGIYTDLGAKGLRGMLFDNCKVTGLYSFENRGHDIFPAVHASYKPILLTFQKGGKTQSFPCAFFLHTADELKAAAASPTILTVDFIRRSSPTSWSVLEIKSPRDHEIVEKLLRHPPLGQQLPNTWNITLSRGFDMTNDSHLFKQNILGGVPMLEGKNIHQFTHKWKEAPVPRYKILEKDVLANLKPDKLYHTGYWMAYRLIARSMDYRTFISTIVPPGYVCGHSIAIVRLPDLKQLCFLTGVMNSFVADYFLRQKVSANITMFNLLETPVPRLSSGPAFDAIVRKAAQLSCTTGEFAELKKAVGIEAGLTNENDRALGRAQLDCLVAKLYGLTKDELAYILTKFPLVPDEQKELVLSQY